jgi:hypothetical protein
MAKKIRDIINRELIVRVPAVKYKQDTGEVGVDANIRIDPESGLTTFTTFYEIDKIVFVTINGITQALERDYIIKDKFTIEFRGVIKDHRTIIVGYHYKKVASEPNLVPPQLQYFYSDISGGGANIIKFTFAIIPNQGSNFYWSIHKDGESSPALNPSGMPLTGTSLSVTAGTPTTNGLDVEVEITQAEYESRPGEIVPFTLIIVYDLTSKPGEDEKLVGTVTYALSSVVESVLHIAVVPNNINTTVVDGVFDVTYRLDKGSYEVFTWEVTDDLGTVIASGDETDYPDIDTVFTDTLSFDYGSPNKTYYMQVFETSSINKISASVINNIAAPLRTSQGGRIGMNSAGQYITNKTTYMEYIHNDPLKPEYFTLKDIPEPPNVNDSTGFLNPSIAYNDGSSYKLVFEIPRTWGHPVGFTLSGNPVDTLATFEIFENIWDATETDDMIDAYLMKSSQTELAMATQYAIIKQ